MLCFIHIQLRKASIFLMAFPNIRCRPPKIGDKFISSVPDFYRLLFVGSERRV